MGTKLCGCHKFFFIQIVVIIKNNNRVFNLIHKVIPTINLI